MPPSSNNKRRTGTLPARFLAWQCGLLAALPLAGSGVARGEAAHDPAARAFLEQHCFKCHGEEKQKGDLRLDTLAAPPGEATRWLDVLNAIQSGEMPPPKEARPDGAETGRVLEVISGAVAQADGMVRPSLRRMNRTEYEHTVQDLLGIDTPLAELLPEDGSVQGFDNVAGGLSISSILMERYLEAANTAFDAVVRRIPPLPAATRRVALMEEKENISSVKEAKGGSIAVENSFVKFTPGWPPARLDGAHPVEDGIYRGRIGVWPWKPGARTLVVAVYVGPLFGPGKRRLMGMYDVTGTAQSPTVIEFTTRMAENDAMHIVPWIYPEHVTWRDKEEAQPGVAVAWAETHGPLDQDFPSAAQKRLFGESKTLAMEAGDSIWMRHRSGMKLHHVTSSTPGEDAERIVRDFAQRAFRRPVVPAVIDPFVKLTLSRIEAGRPFEQAVRAGVCAVLCAPRFLLLNREPVVDDYTLASRLSYFLWSTMPDAALLQLASEGKLRDPAVRHAQVERLLGDARSERFVENFTGQWLDLRKLTFTTPDKQLYPEFDELLQESMPRETLGFFRHLLKNDLSVRNFLDSDFTVLNERLATHYGIDGVKGHAEFRVVPLPPESIRGGLLTQASVLKVTANGTSSSPVLRGVWVLKNILGQSVPPPPPGVPAVEPDIRGATSIRDQLAKHTSGTNCARCHARIDPPGFALECFDPIGGFRDRYRSLGQGDPAPSKKVSWKLGRPVECAGALSGDRTFADFAGFRARLLENPEVFARTLASKLLVHATGRPVTPLDRKSVDAVLDAARRKDFGLRSLIHAVVDSERFRQP